MTEQHNLRKLYFEEGKSITEISKETGRDRKTVRVYLEKEDWNDVRRGSMTEVEFPKLDPFKADIDTWLTKDDLFWRVPFLWQISPNYFLV